MQGNSRSGISGLVGLMRIAFGELGLELAPGSHRNGAVRQFRDLQRDRGPRGFAAALVFRPRRLTHRDRLGGVPLGFLGALTPFLQQTRRDRDHLQNDIAIANERRKEFLRLGDRPIQYGLDMSASKALSPEQNERARALIEKLRETYGTDDALAEAMGISQPQLSEVRSRKKGVGGKVLSGLMRISPVEALAIVGARSSASPSDTMTMARIAAENLVSAGLATEERAWAVMREIQPREPSVDAYYQEARRRLLGEKGSA